MDLESLGLLMVIVGIGIATVGVLGVILKSFKGGRVEGGGVVIVGPIPIVFGSNQKLAGWLMVLALIFFTIILVLNIIGWRFIG